MAEGLLRHLAGDRFEIMSAGTEATSVRPEAIRAMADLGVDISGQSSNTLERYLGEPFDYVVTVCDDANEACPVFPARRTASTGRSRTPRGQRGARRSASRSSGRCGMKFRPASGRNFLQEIGREGRLHRVSPPRPAAPDPRASRRGRPAAGRARKPPLHHPPGVRVVGCAALELYGCVALLRSVAAARDLRGTGLGWRLTEAALELFRHLDVEEAYLLTETADLFFPRFGFRPILRSEVPRSIQRSVEFTSACPASARAMVLDLRAG
jgi:amino-acid N-acetyltransferase